MQNGNIRVRERGNIHFCSRWAGGEFCKDTGMARRVRRGRRFAFSRGQAQFLVQSFGKTAFFAQDEILAARHRRLRV